MSPFEPEVSSSNPPCFKRNTVKSLEARFQGINFAADKQQKNKRHEYDTPQQQARRQWQW